MRTHQRILQLVVTVACALHSNSERVTLRWRPVGPALDEVPQRAQQQRSEQGDGVFAHEPGATYTGPGRLRRQNKPNRPP